MPICRSWYAADTGMGTTGGHKGRQFLISLLSRPGLDGLPVRLGMRTCSPDHDARTRSVATMAYRRQRSRAARCVATERVWSARTSRLFSLFGCVRPSEPTFTTLDIGVVSLSPGCGQATPPSVESAPFLLFPPARLLVLARSGAWPRYVAVAGVGSVGSQYRWPGPMDCPAGSATAASTSC